MGPLTTIAFLVPAAPAGARGVGGRTDLPLPLWLFTYGAGGALLVSFVAFRLLWPVPRLVKASRGRGIISIPDGLRGGVLLGGRLLGLGAFSVVLAAAWWGSDNPGENLAPVAVFVVFWVGLQVTSALFGDVWRLLNPFDTIAAATAWVARHVRGDRRSPARSPVTRDPQHWSAAAMLLAFVWLELGYHDSSSPRAIGVWLTAYSIAVLAGSAVWGRGWLRYGEGFSALFTMLAHISPLFVDRGRLRFRLPFSGLATYETRPDRKSVV